MRQWIKPCRCNIWIGREIIPCCEMRPRITPEKGPDPRIMRGRVQRQTGHIGMGPGIPIPIEPRRPAEPCDRLGITHAPHGSAPPGAQSRQEAGRFWGGRGRRLNLQLPRAQLRDLILARGQGAAQRLDLLQQQPVLGTQRGQAPRGIVLWIAQETSGILPCLARI